MPKRKAVSTANGASNTALRAESVASSNPAKRRLTSSSRKSGVAGTEADLPVIDSNPQTNSGIHDGQTALRASPDASGPDEKFNVEKATIESDGVHGAGAKPAHARYIKRSQSESSLSELSDVEASLQRVAGSSKSQTKNKPRLKKEHDIAIEDPEENGDQEDADPEEMIQALSRPPPINSSYLPLPWKGRLGYACLNTYLRAATPPVFSSRTCRIASILEHRHPLKDPSQPEHPTKNRPDKDQPADIARGQAYVEALGLANARDVPKMLRWNDKYGIKFFRLSSEMFPFASHDVYGYQLAPFAADVLAEAGRVAAELGHRLTTHPGQFTQLGSPRPEVITASFRDLEYHCELLSLLKLPPQQDRDAVMILHMGGVFGDKAATLERFRQNYAKLPQKVKDRLVLENDDVCYSVHDLLPICEELNIPMVLDFHHHNIVFDADKIREGTLDIMKVYDRILATWTRKNITPKMHYSEPTPAAITGRQRRKHNPRPASLPPCPANMDLMIEAKDKEQAVFELMRNFRLPGFDSFNDVIPYTRLDENKAWKPPKNKTSSRKKKKPDSEIDDETATAPQPPPLVPDDEISMGGPENRVYWPPGMEEWLRPKKREVKPRDPEKAKTTAEKAAQRRAEKAAWQAAREASEDRTTDAAMSTSNSEAGVVPKVEIEKTKSVYKKAKESKAKPARAAATKNTKKKVKSVPTPSTSAEEEEEEEEEEDASMSDLADTDDDVVSAKKIQTNRPMAARRQSARSARGKVVNYTVDD